MIGKRISMTAALIAGILLLGGCEKLGQSKWTPQEPAAISIEKDGSVTEFIQDTLDADYYDASELESMINAGVKEYNSKNGEDSIVVKEFTAENGAVNLTMEYASAADYARFNNTEFYYGSMINAQLEGYLFDVSFKKVAKGVVQGSEVSGSEVIKNMDKMVLILRAPLEVQVPGDVLFTSANADVLASDVVNATGEQEETEHELVLPSNEVYRSSDSRSFAEEMTAKRVYIIFDDN